MCTSPDIPDALYHLLSAPASPGTGCGTHAAMRTHIGGCPTPGASPDPFLPSATAWQSAPGSPKSGEKKKPGGGGFNKPVQLGEQLAAFLGGETAMSRPEITKRFWDYCEFLPLGSSGDFSCGSVGSLCL